MQGSEIRQSSSFLGAAGRDPHNFNVLFRTDNAFRVMAFTATQIPSIETVSIRRSLPAPLTRRAFPAAVLELAHRERLAASSSR
jgi:predicted GTPase